jgi:hypothetical protein
VGEHGGACNSAPDRAQIVSLGVYYRRQFHALEPDLRVDPEESGVAAWSPATRPTGLLPRILNPEDRLRCRDI